MEWDEFLEMMIKSRDMARNEKSTGLEHWLDSWLPKLAQMRLVAKQERAEVDKAVAEAKGRRSRRNSVDSANGSDGSAASLALSAAAPDAVKRLAEPRTLSEGEVRELRAAFELIDDDKSGRLDGGEIIDALNAEKVDVDEDAVVQMCVEAGSEDGEISLEQFLWYVAMRAPPNSKNKRKARGRAKVIQRDWWWRWLFPVPEDLELSKRREGEEEDDEARRRQKEGLPPKERPKKRLRARDLRKGWSTHARRTPARESTAGSGRPDQTLKFSSSVKSKSIRLIFGRIDGSRRALEARSKSLCRDFRIRSH